MEKILRRSLKFLAVICIVPVVMLALAPLKGFLVFSAGPPASGDWIVTNTEIYSNHEVFVLNGNLIVKNGGNLTLKGATLKMNCTYDGQYNITVETGGAFYVLEGSVITSVDTSKGYCFFVQDESTFRMSDSELHECGMSSPDDWMKSGLCILSNDTVIEKSLISDNNCGIFIGGGEPVIRNNNITNNEQGIMVGNGSPTIYNNTITSNLDRGIGSGGNTTLPLIINNSISKNWVGIDSWFGSSPIILNNTITSNFDNGIFINHHGNPTISGNIITLNGGSGIGCSNHSNAVIQNNTITANGVGISCGDHSDATIQGNNISQNNGGINCHFSSPNINCNNIISNYQGIWLNNSSPVIQDNIITFNKDVGIGGQFCSPTIQGNTITSNSGYAGIVLKGNIHGMIQGNNIMNNTGDGIQIAHNCSLTIQGNMITSNTGIGIHCNDTARLEVHKNDIYGNAGYGIENDDLSISINATFNYWGSASGPYKGSGLPDSIDPEEVSENVLFDPWLTESIIIAEITNPLQGETVSATVKISVNARAINGISMVEFYIDKQQKYVDFNSPYEWDWDTTQYAETSHEIMVKVIDLFHAFAAHTLRTVFVDNTAPTVSIKEPESGKIYYGIISLSVNATDNKEISSVRFRVDNNEWFVMIYNSTDFFWRYDLNTTTFSDGQHTLMVLALDKAGNPSTTFITLRLDNAPPTLTIQTPQSGMTVGLTLIVSIQASDASNISRIEFYLQDVLVYTATNTPYQWSWDTTEYPNGEYTITIKAYDTVGHVKTSQTSVTVKNVEPAWWQAHFWTIIQVLVATGGLILAVLTYLTGKKKGKKREKKEEE